MNSELKEYLDMAEFRQKAPVSQEPTTPQLLVGGDFSGIQKYIYQIVSKYAAKSLKGRSFYLHLLSDAIVRFLLRKLKLGKDSIVYNSGGSFYLIAPDTAETRQAIEDASLVIERKLFTTHGTDLFLALDFVEYNGSNLREAWTELFNRRRVQKNRRFSRLLKAEPSLFFEPSLNGGEYKRDAVTGEELEERVKPIKGLYYSESTSKQREIGAALYNASYLYITENLISGWKELMISPCDLGVYYYFVQKEEVHSFLRACGDIKPDVEEIKGSFSWKIPSFEEMSETFSDDEDTFERIGVLRMDVDNLGLLFQQGIPAESATLERYRTLSKKFDYFFGDYLHTLVDPYRTLVIYSGGDDIFVVGAWDETIVLATRIREQFRKYTKNDSSFSISGGIAILKAKYPIMKGAEESAIEESAAKEHVVTLADGKKLTKNSISFMDMPLNWDEEFPVVEKLKDELVKYLEKEQIKKSFLRKVMNHAANAGFSEKMSRKNSHKLRNFKTYWMLTYDLSRMKQELKNEQVCMLIDNCIKEVCKGGGTLNGQSIKTDYHPLELWQFACRWAELE